MNKILVRGFLEGFNMKSLIKVVLFIIFSTILAFGANKKIIINLSEQMAYAYEGNTLVYKGWISSGKRGHRTPTGVFRVLQKDIDHESNEWPKKKEGSVKKDGGAKMPYMLRLTWTGIALHEGFTPNRPASHGCIRLKKAFAKKLFYWAELGTKVIVKGKAPRRVVRQGRGFTDYIALAKAKKVKRKRKRVYLAKKSSKREKIINYYAKLSYKKINRILKRSYKKKRLILASKYRSKYSKIRELRKIKWLVNILKEAKYKKYIKRVKHKKRFAKKIYYKRLT